MIRHRDSGFTMIELLIVVSLIVILTTMGMTQYRHSVIYAREGVLKEDLFRLRDAIDQYYADKGKYPDSLQTLVSEQYIRAVPIDPFTNSADTWQTVQAEPEPGSTSAVTGIYDVHSGSDGTSIDGMRLADK